MFRSLAFLLTLVSCSLLTTQASADFTSTFNIPNGGTIISSGAVGNWYLTTAGSGGPALLNTSGAPSSVSLNSSATGPGSATSVTLEFPSVAEAGTVSVDFNLSASSASGDTPSSATFTIYINGSAVDTYSSTMVSTAVVPVLTGDDLAFFVSSSGGIINPPLDPVTHIPTGGPTILTGSSAVTLSNFTFTPVPEPGTTAALVGVTAFSLMFLRRRQKN